MAEDSPIVEYAGVFNNQFSRSKQRVENKRAAKRFVAETATCATARSFLLGLLPADSTIQTSDPKLDRVLCPAAFGVIQDNLDSAFESCKLANVRVSLAGTRAIIAAHGADIINFMTDKGVGGSFDQRRVELFFKNFTAESTAEFANRYDLYHALIGGFGRCRAGPG